MRRRMRRSSAGVRFSTYQTSSSIRSSHGIPARPLTCAQPVSPGLTSRRRRWCGVYSATWAGSVGRGPTIASSPRRTLTRFGSSSSEKRRRKWPAPVTRSSPANTGVPTPTGSLPTFIVRSFSRSNSRPSSPERRER